MLCDWAIPITGYRTQLPWILMSVDILALMDALSKWRPIFHSEADFQHAFAWQLHKFVPGVNVRLEFKPLSEERIYLDIWIPTHRIAIELKFLTRGLSVEWMGELFSLRNQGAQDIRRYDFLRDIQRLERVLTLPNPASEAYALCLTNDAAY